MATAGGIIPLRELNATFSEFKLTGYAATLEDKLPVNLLLLASIRMRKGDSQDDGSEPVKEFCCRYR